ncbi:MAG: GMC family oxidoreductase [Nocardioidaceae bacterium]|nr:GMC family oxidoreductase [Nocardioidaceae bacterium]
MTTSTPAPAYDYDVVVVGSGFGGSVTALRLTEKGYRVGVMEAGARFDESTYPKNSWDLKRFWFAPVAGCYGIQRIDVLKHCLILSGAGVGGGSLVYGNTLYEPPEAFYQDRSWSHITDWRAELAPYYGQAKRMLGAVTNPTTTPSDVVMKQVADEMGVGDTFRPTPVGVFFGPPGDRVADPYFGGVGPQRRGCIECGECMTGCRHHAKNTLTKNYLFLAEQAGAVVHPLTTVTEVRPMPGGGYRVAVRPTDAKAGRRRRRKSFTAEQVVFAASALGTQRLLHRMRDDGVLPRLSDRLGSLTRTNSESIVGAVADGRDVDFSRGAAITSSFHPDEQTHVEPVRYGHGSNAMSLLQTVLTDDHGDVARWRVWLKELWRQRRSVKDRYDVRHWSERTVIALAMQTVDNSITTYTEKSRLPGRRRLTSRQGHGLPNPTWIPAANEVARRMARIVKGAPGGAIGEPFGRPLTAHFIGGCTIGDSAETGVVDAYHRVYGHPGLHVADGSVISANLGVNPSLTITAQTERAMALWPNRGDPDHRPEPGTPYQRISAVPPANPVVPDHAPGALRLPTDGSAGRVCW